jgi:hypothetical protein
MLFKGKQYLMRIIIFLTSLIVCNIFAMSQNKTYVDGSLCGFPTHASLDHKLAVNMVENRADSGVRKLFSEYSELNSETLKKITMRYSMDVASVFLVEKLYHQPANKQIQDYYLQYIDTVSPKYLKRNLFSLKNI